MVPAKGIKKILITGGAGFIGSHLVEDFLGMGYEIRVLDNFSTGKRQNLENLGSGALVSNKDFEVINGDIRDMSVVRQAVSGMDAVLHQAALGSVPRSVEDPITTQQVNADGTLNVFLAARESQITRIVYASSSSVYGDSDRLPKTEGQEGLPLSPYALTKKVNEEYGRLFKALYGVETIGLRYFNVYGPKQDPESEYAAVIPRFVKALIQGCSPIIFGSGEQSRDFTYVKDVVHANKCALEAPSDACGKCYNVGRGDRTTLLNLIQALQEVLQIHVEPQHDAPRLGDVMHSLADTSLAEKMLGFAARHDLRAGLSDSVAWYRENLT